MAHCAPHRKTAALHRRSLVLCNRHTGSSLIVGAAQGWLICSNLWTANSYTWQTLMYARALSGLQESFDEIALGYFFITQLGPDQRAWGAVALAFVLRLHATIGPLLGAAILSQLQDPEDPENYRTILWIEACCRLVPLGFVCFFVPTGLGVVPPTDTSRAPFGERGEAASTWLEARGRSRCRRWVGNSSWGHTARHSWRSLLLVAGWSSIIFFVTKCWSSYAVPLRASELSISKLTLQFSQSVEEAVAIPTQLIFGWILQRSEWGLKSVGFINGVLWGASLLLVGYWVGENDDAGFYWAHALYGVGYGGYIVNDVAKATLAPKPDEGAADWLAMLHTIKDVINIGIPPLMVRPASIRTNIETSVMCTHLLGSCIPLTSGASYLLPCVISGRDISRTRHQSACSLSCVQEWAFWQVSFFFAACLKAGSMAPLRLTAVADGRGGPSHPRIKAELAPTASPVLHGEGKFKFTRR